MAASEGALSQLLDEIFKDLLGFAGIEMHRRILGLAHVAELSSIEDDNLRGKLEQRCLELGRMLVTGRKSINGIERVTAFAKRIEYGEAS